MKRPFAIRNVFSISFLVAFLSFVTILLPNCYGDSDTAAQKTLDLKLDTSEIDRDKQNPVPTSYSHIVEKVSGSVVNVLSKKVIEMDRQNMPFKHPFFRRFFGDDFEDRIPEEKKKRHQRSLGSGVIISKEGYVLTNHHNIKNADEVKVAFDQGEEEYEAKIVGSDSETDLAVLKVDTGKDLPVATLGDSDRLKVGDIVFAIGNPFGVGKTVTKGIVSAQGRGVGRLPYENFIQTDAPINPGNSGGPLIDAKGRVIGINTMIMSRAGGSQGVGFAIPINLARSITKQLVEKGEVSRGYLGVQIQKITPALKDHFGLERESGVLISQVMDEMPAKKAGLQRGDVIVGFDGDPVKNMRDLRFSVAKTSPGKTVDITVIRDGNEKTFEVLLAERPSDPNRGGQSESSLELFKGVSLQPLNNQIRNQLELPAVVDGLVVTEVEPGSPAASAGLQKGDVIMEVNRKKVTTIKDIREALKARKGDEALLYIWREGSGFYLSIAR